MACIIKIFLKYLVIIVHPLSVTWASYVMCCPQDVVLQTWTNTLTSWWGNADRTGLSLTNTAPTSTSMVVEQELQLATESAAPWDASVSGTSVTIQSSRSPLFIAILQTSQRSVGLIDLTKHQRNDCLFFMYLTVATSKPCEKPNNFL